MPLATCPHGNRTTKRLADDFDFNGVLKLTEELKKIRNEVSRKESSENTLLPLMKNLTGHHWITHGVFSVLVSVLLEFAFGKMNNGMPFSRMR